MQAVILAGGKGTRIREQHPDIPKILIPAAEKPFILHQIKWLQDNDISDIHLSLGYKAEWIQEWITSNPVAEINISTSVEEKPLGTGGGLKFSEPSIISDPFICMNGDTLLPNLDLQAFTKAHNESQCAMSLAIVPTETADQFGSIKFNDQNKLISFREKAEKGEGWVNGGVYVMSREILDSIESGRAISIEHDIFPKLTEQGSINVYKCDPPLLDMGTPEGLDAMEEFLKSRL